MCSRDKLIELRENILLKLQDDMGVERRFHRVEKIDEKELAHNNVIRNESF